MNIYLLEQDLVDGYDTYDSAVVIAESEEKARDIHPAYHDSYIANGEWMSKHTAGKNKGRGFYIDDTGGWPEYTDISVIKVTLIGIAKKNESGLVLASFNAG